MSPTRTEDVTKAVVYPSGEVHFDPESGLVDCGMMVDFKSPPCCDNGPKKAVHVYLTPQKPRTWISECVHCTSTWTYVETP